MARRTLLAAVVAVAFAACGEGQAAASPFFAAWEQAWSGGDGYELARFYHPDAALRDAQPDLEITYPAGFLNATTDGDGRAWLAEWFEVQTQPQERVVEGLFVGENDAVVLMSVPGLSTAVLFDVRMEAEVIRTQTTLRWRDARKLHGTPDERLAPTDALVAAYLSERLPNADVEGLATGDYSGPALFVEPGGTPGTVAFVATSDDECSARVAIVLTVADGEIVAERRLADAAAPADCHPGGRWWASLPIPPPVEEQVTGSVAHPGGYTIEIVNGTPELERFVDWGLARFEAGGLEAPPVETVSFAPIPACRDVSGVVVEAGDGGSPDLVQCTDAFAVCLPDRATCSTFDVSFRLSLLHELGHAWLLAHADDGVQAAFLEASGTETWRGADVPWHRRGVERAADTIAWGLMDEPVAMTRFGGPPCEESAAAFEALTGTLPVRTCP